MNPQQLASSVLNIMTDYEDHCLAHGGRVAAYASHYRDVDAILDANADVKALGE